MAIKNIGPLEDWREELLLRTHGRKVLDRYRSIIKNHYKEANKMKEWNGEFRKFKLTKEEIEKAVLNYLAENQDLLLTTQYTFEWNLLSGEATTEFEGLTVMLLYDRPKT